MIEAEEQTNSVRSEREPGTQVAAAAPQPEPKPTAKLVPEDALALVPVRNLV
jgi:hypothetical protein